MKKASQLILPSVILMLMNTSCGRSNRMGMQQDPVQQVTVFEVKKEKAEYYDSYPGNTVALKEVEIRGGVTGYLTNMYFKEGAHVRMGEKLYEIDRSKYAAALEQAKANVQIAGTNLDKTQRDYDRYSNLAKEEAIAQQTLDNAATDLRDAQLQLVTSKAALVQATTDYEYSLILAPFEGTIGISQVKIGTLVTPGQTLLNTISSDDPMGVDIEVNEKELDRFEQLDHTASGKNDSTFLLVLPNDSTYRYSGSIFLIDRAVDPETGTIRVRLTFPNRERTLKPGMTCNVRISNNRKDQEIMIPSKAVVEQMGEYFVFRVNGNKAQEVKIQPGKQIGENVIVPSGLNAGDRIVVEGIQKLRDGTEIEITNGKNQGPKAYKH